MEGPGLSLFQGSESIHLNTSAQGLEEDEEQEDFKRRNKEIKDLLTNAFDDLDDDNDNSSIDSSHYHNNTKDAEITSTVLNSAQGIIPSKGPTVSQLQNEFGIYDHVENLNNYDNTTTNHRSELEMVPTMSDMHRNFNMYDQTDTSYSKSNRNNDVNNVSPDTPYELARPLNVQFPRVEVEDEYTFNENYPYNYHTPSNHYEAQNKNYPNNGYIDGYKNSVQVKQMQEFGAGDSTTSDHLNHCYKTSPNGRPKDDHIAYKCAEYESKEQLEVLYTVRMREIKRLTDELQQIKLEKEEEKNQLGRKVTLLQAEIERSNISRNQTQHALVDAKAEIVDLHNQITSLKEKNAVLDKSNQNMAEELNVAKDSVIELQQKIVVLERVQGVQATDKINEKFLKQAQEKHAVEMKNMQTQIDVLTDKLNAKEVSYVALENKLVDVRRAHETLMVEKGDTMNRLAQALEESQAQCRNLMATNNAQQVMQLQAQVTLLTQEKEEMQKIVQELQNKLEVAKSDIAHYDSLLATSPRGESDSIRQMKLGELYNISKSKSCDDITNKLRGELQRCLAGQAVKRKEITRLENTISQKEKEVDKALIIADTCRQEAARYAKRANELEQELKTVLTDQAMKANAQIQKLSSHLSDVKKQYESLREEKLGLEQKLEETLAINQETLKKLHQESVNQLEKDAIDEYNKEYLEIHAKAVERVRQEAQIEIVQLSVQLEQTQKELDRVKELYIDVCSTKEQLISEHRSEIKILKDKYSTLEMREKDIEKYEHDLRAQVKITEKLTQECDTYRSKVIELEKDINHERMKKEEYARKIHQEIERAKEEALNELRNAHPNQEISVLLPDHCSEHLQKITQLEEDCKRLEEKLHAAVDEHKKMSDYQSELNDARLKIAQIEITQESWKKKYENVVTERNDLIAKVSKLNSELSSIKRHSKIEDSDDAKLKVARYQVENEGLKNKCESLTGEKGIYKDKITQLEAELSETKKILGNFENRFKKSSEMSLNSKCELEKELSHYKDLVTQLSSKINQLKTGRKSDLVMEQRIKQLEKDLQEKEEELERLKDFEKIKGERDQLILKLKNQAKQFEQYVKNQKQVSAELNLSPRSSIDGTDFQKIKEIMIKEVREEMEQKVIEELRGIEEQHRERRKELEDRYKTILLELQTRCNEKTQEVETLKEVMLAEKVKIHSSFKAKEQFVSQMIETKLETYYKELVARKLKIEKLQEELKQKENDVDEERNLMAQVMTKWAAEIREIKNKETEMSERLQQLKNSEENLKSQLNALKEKEVEMKNSIDTLKHKYQSAKKTANNYKEHAENKEKFLLSECKRIEEGYKRAMNQVQQKLEAIVSTQEEQVATKLKELECQYSERIEQMRLTLKYKSKC